MKRFLLLFSITLGVLAAAPAADDQCEFDGVDRIVAVGDVHGAYDRFVEILTTAGVIDKRLRWTGAKTHLVQLGDVLDRGPDSRKAMDLL
jgi:fructose-1,6-bisphosphatase